MCCILGEFLIYSPLNSFFSFFACVPLVVAVSPVEVNRWMANCKLVTNDIYCSPILINIKEQKWSKWCNKGKYSKQKITFIYIERWKVFLSHLFINRASEFTSLNVSSSSFHDSFFQTKQQPTRYSATLSAHDYSLQLYIT